MSYPPIDSSKIKPHLDKADSKLPEELRRESMENIYEFVEANRPELKAGREWRQDILDSWNELQPMTSFRR